MLIDTKTKAEYPKDLNDESAKNMEKLAKKPLGDYGMIVGDVTLFKEKKDFSTSSNYTQWPIDVPVYYLDTKTKTLTRIMLGQDPDTQSVPCKLQDTECKKLLNYTFKNFKINNNVVGVNTGIRPNEYANNARRNRGRLIHLLESTIAEANEALADEKTAADPAASSTSSFSMGNPS